MTANNLRLLFVTCLFFAISLASNTSLSAEPESLDVDMSGEVSALTDGLLIIRSLFGFSGQSLVGGALSDDAFRDSPQQIEKRITDLGNAIDVDADGEVLPLTDGLLIIRALFEFSGESLILGALGNLAEGTASTISQRIRNLSIATTNPTDLTGRYDGSSRTGIFGEESATIFIELNAKEINIETDLFFSPNYRFKGAIDSETTPFSTEGTYVTSDFQEGNWEAKKIIKISKDALYLKINNGFGDLRMVGFLEEEDLKEKVYSTSKTYANLLGDDLHAAQGSFKGRMKTYGNCSDRSFEISPTDFKLDITNGIITLTQTAFFEGTCVLTGALAPNETDQASISGTFQCSNFTSGSWATQDIAFIDEQVLYAPINFKTNDDTCEYRVAYLVQK